VPDDRDVSADARADADRRWMAYALSLAEQAETQGEVPVGAVIIDEAGRRIGEGENRMIRDADPTAHAEIVALRKAAASLGNYRLPGTTLYVTLEPCAMCAGALVQARVARVVFAARDPRAGACGSVFQVLQHSMLNHRCEVDEGLLAEEAGQRLRDFFRARRK
jgi:tRNA(adenine34) deaminase